MPVSPLEDRRYRQDEPDFNPELDNPDPVEPPTDEQPIQSPAPDESLTDRIARYRDTGQDIYDKQRFLRDKYQAWREGRLAAKGGLQAGEKEVVAKAEQKIASQAGKSLAGQASRAAVGKAAQAGATAGLEAAAEGAAVAAGAETAGIGFLVAAGIWLGARLWHVGRKYGGYILVGVAVLLLLPTLIFALLFLNTGPNDKADTAAEKTEISLVRAASGDTFEKRGLTEKTITAERTRYQKILALGKDYSGSLSYSDLEAGAKEITTLIGGLEKANKAGDKAKVKELFPALLAKKKSFEARLPYGEWVARIAEKYASQKTGSAYFCVATGAPGNLGCASVVSRILNDAAVPQQLCATTMCVWDNPLLGTVVEPAPHPTLNRSLYSTTKGRLKRGDIVWWGNGIRGGQQAYDGALFNHIGIYVGNDKTVDNSSSKLEVLLRDIGTGGRVFNGAKRYGS